MSQYIWGEFVIASKDPVLVRGAVQNMWQAADSMQGQWIRTKREEPTHAAELHTRTFTFAFQKEENLKAFIDAAKSIKASHANKEIAIEAQRSHPLPQAAIYTYIPGNR